MLELGTDVKTVSVLLGHAKDHMVTLSTCAYNFENARYVVLGRLDLAWERYPVLPAPVPTATPLPN